MVGIVLVSHSLPLAEGLLALLRQMAPDAAVALAAGTDNPDAPIGTDPMRVYGAIETVYSADGVLILMDLGSAIMSAEAAIEFLDPDQQAQIYLCEVPLVEGALAAAVAAAGGAGLAQVLTEARAALPAKLAQLEPILRIKPPVVATTPTPVPIAAADAEVTLTIPNRLGLHARPAARLVELVNRFAARVTLTIGARTIDAGSITQVITSGARQGDLVKFAAAGPDSAAVLAAIQQLVAQNFGDAVASDVPTADAATTDPTVIDHASIPGQPFGLPASSGIAIGTAFVLGQQTPAVVCQSITDVVAEQHKFAQAVAAAKAALAALAQTLATRASADEVGILTAQQLMLADPALLARVNHQIATEAVNAPWAWQQAIDSLVADYQTLEDDYLRRRAADVRDVGNRVLRHLAHDHAAVTTAPTMREPVILVAAELTPSDTAALDPALVLGIVTATGGATGHAAIIARSLGIPVVTGVADALALIRDGQEVALDGSSGQLWLALDAETKAVLQARREEWLAGRNAARTLALAPAITTDGHRIEIAANIGSAAEVAPALAQGAEGVGLFRTEFLFMGRTQAPDEETQFQAYRAAALALGDRPLLIRTLDVGGDKPLPYLGIGVEENPFLGWRGIRYCLDNPTLFRTQLRAILRAGYGQRLQVMFPMVSTVAEVEQARALLAAEAQVLRAAGIDCAENLAVGIMIETPAAVLNATRLAAVVDFFSIGTNDLTQYLMAADRGNAKVAGLIDALQPAVIGAIAQVTAAAHAAGIWVGICGELAGDPLATALLVGLGIDELSMSAPAIPAVKAQIRAMSHRTAVELAQTLLALPHATAIRAALAAH